ncbi:MAG: hypothetical protein WAW79_08210 [Steroidobacteraceae bacterium]
MIVTVLLTALGALTVAFTGVLIQTAIRRHELRPTLESIGLGAITNFFDTLGIGSFATSTAWIKLRNLVPDSFIPGTLNVGHALPTVAQAYIFIKLVDVDPILLAACIAAAVAGSIIGAPIVVRLPVRVVQGVVGIALLIAASLYALSNMGMMPVGGDALALAAGPLAIAVVGHFVMGALMTFGIGLYAPSLILLSLLGLNPIAAFPIMMGACAFLMPVCGMRFIRAERINLRVVIGLALGGIPLVLVAAFLVKSLPLETLRWGVVVVVLYAAILLLRSAVQPSMQQEAGVKLAQ